MQPRLVAGADPFLLQVRVIEFRTARKFSFRIPLFRSRMEASAAVHLDFFMHALSYTLLLWGHGAVRMPHKNPMISPTKKGEMYGKYKHGMTMSQLLEEYKRPKSAIQGIIEHRESTGTVKPSWNSGNEHILSPEDEQRLIRQVRRNLKQTSAQLFQIEDVSPSTIERILKSHGYIRAICRRKPILKALNVAQRLEWASANAKQDWRRVIFTDEAAFKVGDD